MPRNRRWVQLALSALQNSLGPVPTELNEIDWKSGLSGNKERLAEHLSAFANHPNGGFIAFGIDNTGKPADISKENAEKYITRLANIGRDAVEPPVPISHSIEKIYEHDVLIVYIKESDVKPVHIRGKSLEYAFIRSGGTTRRASRQEIGSMLLNSSNPRWEELRASKLMSFDSVLSLINVEAICKLLNKPNQNNNTETSEWLTNEKMIVPDGDLFYITNLGAISAAKNLEDFDSLSRKRIRVIRYKGLNKVDTVEEEIVGKRGYAVAFERLIKYLKSKIPHSEIIKEVLRKETSLYPEIALRELIANALVHQDFTVTGAGPTVEIFDNRIEFTNPGTLLPSKKVDRLIGTNPESRNELLASLFRRYGICEERGTGFQKVVTSVELYGMPPIKLRQGENSFKVTLFSPRKFSEMSHEERIEACYQHAVLKYLSSSALTNTSLRERLKMHEKQRTKVSNIISDAIAAGRIRRKDENSSPKFAEYLPYWA